MSSISLMFLLKTMRLYVKHSSDGNEITDKCKVGWANAILGLWDEL